MRKFVWSVWVAVLCVLTQSATVRAQTQDTLRHLPDQPVEITALRPSDLPTLDPRSAEIKPVDVLVQHTGNYVASDALRALSSSLDVRRYSTLGGIALASFRGLPVEYTLVYRDGIRVTSEQNSLTDLAQLTLHGLTNVELIPASSAVLLGGDAIGAAINLVSRTFDTTLMRVGTEQTAYSHGKGLPTNSYYATLSAQPVHELSMSAGYSLDQSTGAFPFYQAQSKQYVLRENNDARLQSMNLNAAWAASNSTLVRFYSNYFDADRGVGGVATTPERGASSLTARQTDHQAIATVRAEHDEATWHSTAAFSYQNQFESYTDVAYGTRDSTWNAIYNLDLTANAALNSKLTAYGGLNLLHTRLAGTTNKSSNGDSIFTRDRAGAYVALASTPIQHLEITASLRGEFISALTSELLPQATIGYEITSELRASAAWSKTFHAPTLNELHWKGLGRTGLSSERGSNLQAALEYSPGWQNILPRFSATYFDAAIENEIVWLPSNDGQVHPININQVHVQGAELRTEATIGLWRDLALHLEESYTFLDARDKTIGSTNFGNELQYTSPTSSLFIAQLSKESWGSLALMLRYRGHRFTDPANTAASMLQPGTTTDLTISTRTFHIDALGFRALLSVQNLSDETYFEAPNYPLPGRTYKFSIELQYQ